ADDLVDELVAGAPLERLEDDVAVPVLAPPARLLLVLALRTGRAPDRLEVRDARLAQVDLDAEPPAQPVDRDLDVHLAHSREQRLAGLRVAAQRQRRVLLVEPA